MRQPDLKMIGSNKDNEDGEATDLMHAGRRRGLCLRPGVTSWFCPWIVWPAALSRPTTSQKEDWTEQDDGASAAGGARISATALMF